MTHIHRRSNIVSAPRALLPLPTKNSLISLPNHLGRRTLPGCKIIPSSLHPSSRRISLNSASSSSQSVEIERCTARFCRINEGTSRGPLDRRAVRRLICWAAGSEYFGQERQMIGTNSNVPADRKKFMKLAMAVSATVVLGVANRVLGKLALVPLKNHPFFLAQFATFGYVIVYFSILWSRYHAGIVTSEMLSMPKTPFVIIGFLEALAAAIGMAATAVLSGALVPILSQTYLVWQLLLSIVFLRRRYRYNQLLGCLLVVIGVITTVASGSSSVCAPNDANILWTLVMILSFLLQAADSVLKETVFMDSYRKGKPIDIFVVNSYGSAFQVLFACLLVPLLSRLQGVPFHQLFQYLTDGAACFLNVAGLSSACDGAPLLPLLFVLANMAFNISLLHLLKISSAVVSSLASTFSVPIAVYVFTLPLPYLGVACALPPGFVAGAVILTFGLLLYLWTPQTYR